MRDLTKFQCPCCFSEKGDSFGRTCNICGYNGDWIQPNETRTYAQNRDVVVLTTDAEETVIVHDVNEYATSAGTPTIELRIEYRDSDGRAASAFLSEEETEKVIQRMRNVWAKYTYERER